MSSGVFVIRDGSLVEMEYSYYESELILQDLLVKFPNLIPGKQIDVLNPRKWLVVSKEFGVPSKANASDKWSLDHLFVDQDGIPTLIEVKRSKNREIRRQIVGQMMDYAANATEYWNIDRIITKYENRCIENGLDPEEEWSEKLGLESSYQEYWKKVKTNLENEKLRLLFVADDIPPELKRITEFMNNAMENVDVFAVGIPQFKEREEQGLKTMISTVYGHTTKTRSRKSTPKKDRMTQEEFFSNVDEEGKLLFSALFDAASKEGYDIHPVSTGFHIRVKISDNLVVFCEAHPNRGNSPQNVVTAYNPIFAKLPETEELLSYRIKFMATGLFRDKGKKHEVNWVIGKKGVEKIPHVVQLYMDLAKSMIKSTENSTDG